MKNSIYLLQEGHDKSEKRVESGKQNACSLSSCEA